VLTVSDSVTSAVAVSWIVVVLLLTGIVVSVIGLLGSVAFTVTVGFVSGVDIRLVVLTVEVVVVIVVVVVVVVVVDLVVVVEVLVLIDVVVVIEDFVVVDVVVVVEVVDVVVVVDEVDSFTDVVANVGIPRSSHMVKSHHCSSQPSSPPHTFASVH